MYLPFSLILVLALAAQRIFANCIAFHTGRTSTAYLVAKAELAQERARALWLELFKEPLPLSAPSALSSSLSRAEVEALLSDATGSLSLPADSAASASSSSSSAPAPAPASDTGAVTAVLDWLTDLIRRPAYFDFVLPVNTIAYPDYTRFVSRPMEIATVWVRNHHQQTIHVTGMMWICVAFVILIMTDWMLPFSEQPGVGQVRRRWKVC